MDCNIDVLFPIEPPSSVNLGEDYFCVVNKFQDKAYAHIRKYGSTPIRYYPTGKGIALSKSEFTEFMTNAEQHKQLVQTTHSSKVVFINSTLVVSVSVKADGRTVTFLKGNDNLATKCVSITVAQFETLCDAKDKLLNYINEIEDSVVN